MGIEFRILGPVQVALDGTVPSLGGNRERAVLALLLLSANQVVSADRLAEDLWDGRPPEAATAALQVYVSRLRKALGQSSRDGVLRTRPPGYLIQIEPDQLDANRFAGLVARGREEAANGDHHGAAATLREALTLWRGPALADVVEVAFARNEAARLEEARLAALEERIEADLACGHHAEVIPELDGLTRTHRVRERLWAQRMTALYRAGRQADALRAYQDLRAILGEDLGIEPSGALVRLETAILRQDPALDWQPAPQRIPPRPVRETADIEEQLRQMPFTGRDAELARLEAHLTEAAGGRSGVVMVVGDPGIGKTRLAEELAAHARQNGWTVAWGRCFEGNWMPAYAPFAEVIETLAMATEPERLAADFGSEAPVLAQLVPRVQDVLPAVEAPGALQPDEERFRLLDAVAHHLLARSEQRPLLLCLDDLHWADAGSVAMLTHLANLMSEHRLLVVGTFRDSEVGRGHPLAEVLPTLGRRSSFERLPLLGLRAEAVRALLTALTTQEVPGSVAAALAGETDGNPFFLREVLRHLIEEGTVFRDDTGQWTSDLTVDKLGIPQSVREVIERRLARLSEAAGRCLSVACAFEGPFGFDVVTRAASLSEEDALDALDETLSAHLLEEVGPDGTFGFTHALIRHTLYSEVSSPRRARLHRRVAEALAAAIGDHPDPARAGEIAHHYRRSASLAGADRGVDFALQAAEHSEATGAHDEAARFLRTAEELLPAGDARRPRILGRLGVALIWALAFDEAVPVAIEAGEAIADAEGAVAAAEYLADATYACQVAGSSPHGWQLARRGLVHASEQRNVAWALLVSFDGERQAAEDEEHPGIPHDTPERRESARILRAARLDPFGPTPLEAVFSTRAEAEETRNLTLRALFLGEYTDWLTRLEEEKEACLRSNRVARAAQCANRLGGAYSVLGRIDDARRSIEETRVLYGRLGRPVFYYEVEDWFTTVTGEGWEHLRDLFWPLADTAPPAARWALGYIRAASARTAARLGDQPAALRFLALTVPWLERAPPWTMYFQVIVAHAAETLWLLERLDHLEVIEQAVRNKVIGPDFCHAVGDGRHAMARLCALRGRYDEASSWFAGSRLYTARLGALPMRAIADYDEALMYTRRGRAGDFDLASPLLELARQQFESIGMTGWLRRADELAARLNGCRRGVNPI